MRYGLDTSAILNAWRKHYPPDVFPSLWDKVDELVQKGLIVASEEVLAELEKKDDEVYHWAQQRSQMFVPIDGHIQQAVRDILRRFPRLLDTRKNRSGADPFVIALAQLEGCTVVTDESPTSNDQRPHIPDVCHALGVRCLNLITMAREQGWKI